MTEKQRAIRDLIQALDRQAECQKDPVVMALIDVVYEMDRQLRAVTCHVCGACEESEENCGN